MLLELELKAGESTLSVHCGVGSGTITGYNVGGGDGKNRWEYVVTGDPISQIGSAEPEAEAGQVVISQKTHEVLGALCEGKKLESKNFLLLKLPRINFKQHEM
jgi:class 3 adenylate cyclase